MEFSYQDYYNEMNKIYFSVYHWPQPYQYQIWFDTLPPQQQVITVNPTYYTQIYTYSIQNASLTTGTKSTPLTRGQKRRKKKLEMQAELQKQKKAIGDWVRLQRKDLIEGLQKIEEKEKKKRKKKEDKLSHLIQINKEVAKHYQKKNKNTSHPPKRVDVKQNKKRLSYVKKLKRVFDRNKLKYIGLQKKEEEWQSDAQQEKVEKSKEEKVDKRIEDQIAKVEQEAKEIKYCHAGKLTGIKHNNVVLRQWVRNCPSQKLDDLVLRTINRLAYKQAIRRVQKPDKAKKLIVSGLKQTKRTLTTIIDKKKSKMIVIALNIERNPYKGGVDDQVLSIIELAQSMKIPVIHACIRSHLGRAFSGKWGPRATIVSIINYEGYQDMVDETLEEWRLCSKKYEDLP